MDAKLDAFVMVESERGVPAGRILGRYVLYDEIAAGGMASVHLGRILGPQGFSRTVAIKRMHAQLARDPEFSERFVKEAKLAARITHANVVPILDVVALAGELFIVMEFVRGESLSRLFRAATEDTQQGIPLPVGLTIVTDLLYGLHAAHEAKSERGEPLLIVHRDVSPHNVMVGNDGVARVLDFGLAKATAHQSTTRSGLKGKFAYISPEQVRQGPIDRRADIFAASIILWEIVTGTRLFASDDPGQSVNRVMSEVITPPNEIVPSLPQAINDIVMKGLERNRDRRFRSAHEMASAIESVAQLARPAEVGRWVEKMAADVLRDRADLIARMEGGGIVARESEAPRGDRAPPSESTMQLARAGSPRAPSPAVVEPSFSASAADLSFASHRAASQKWRAGLIVGAVVAGAVAFAIGARKTTLDARSATSASGMQRVAAPAPPPSDAARVAPSVAPSASATSEADAAATTAPATSPAAKTKKPSKRGECDPPHYFDADGVKRFKPRCL